MAEPASRPEPPPRGPPPRRRRWRAAALIALAGLGVLALAALALLAERGRIAGSLAGDYLRRRGVPGEVRVTRLDARGVEGAVRLGPAGAPTLDAPHVRIDFAPLSGLAAPTVTRVTLDRPVLRIGWDGRRLDLGTLQPLVDDALRRPSGGGGRAPDVVVTGGEVRARTPYGPVVAGLDARLQAGALRAATLALHPADLAAGPARAHALSGRLRLRAADRGRYAFDLTLAAPDARLGGARLAGAGGEARGELAYAPGAAFPLAGPIQANWRAHAQALSGGGAQARALDAQGALDGALDGGTHAPPPRGAAAGGRQPRFTGQAEARLTGGEVRLDAATLQDVQLQVAAAALSASARGVATDLQASARARAGAARVGGAPAALSGLEARASGPLRWAPGAAPVLDLTAALSGAASLAPQRARALAARWAPGPYGADLRPALARALERLSLSAPDLRLRLADGRARARLAAPADLDGAGGAHLALAAPRWTALTPARVAAPQVEARLSGGGLPQVRLSARDLRAEPGGARAQVRVEAQGSAGPLREASLQAAARVALDRGRLRAELDGCAPLALALWRGEDGAALAQDLSARLCPRAGAPLLLAGARGWRLAAQVRALALQAPAARLSLSGAAAELVAHGAPGSAARGWAQVTQARVADTAAPLRFRPLRLNGPLRLDGARLSGDLAAALEAPAGALPLGRLAVDDDLAADRGVLAFTAQGLAFAPDGLQPAAVVPGLAALGRDVAGHADVTLRLDLGGGETRAAVRFTTRDLQLRTAAGLLQGVATDLHLSALDPLASPPGQVVTAARLQGLAPMSDLSARFALGGDAVSLEGAHATLAGGAASLDPMRIPLKPGGELSGAVRVRGVDLGALLSALNLSKALKIDARLDGALPFSFGPQGLRIAGGRLAAAGPGRLTLNRAALTGVSADGGAAGASPSAVEDFAFKALEDLAFTELEADVASRPQGRLGVVLHVRGQHEPPVAEPARVGLLDLLRGRAFSKRIPLPKGTEVNLTLDSSINLDDLLRAYLGLSAPAGSAQVQPPGAKPAAQ